MNFIPVTLHVEGDALAPLDYEIGSIKVPAENETQARDLLLEWWGEWREEVDNPDSDSEFVTWLLLRHGCLPLVNDLIVVTLPS